MSDDVNITLSLDEIQEHVARLALEDLPKFDVHKLARKQVEAHVAEACEELTRDIVVEHMREAVNQIMADGWQKTDEYGNPSGNKLTLRARIEAILHAKNQYNSSKNRIEEMIQVHVEHCIRTVLAEELKVIKASFHEQVSAAISETLMAQLQKSIASSVESATAQVLKSAIAGKL